MNLVGFWTAEIGPYEAGWGTARIWWRVGHTAFWLAVFMVVVAFMVRLFL